MIKIYGMPTCPYCDYVHEQVRGREDEFEYINIGENISNMGAFIRLRDAHTVDQFLHPFRLALRISSTTWPYLSSVKAAE